ncbi:MAG: tRNA pseudouridine(55) synthase TruB [Eubacterium sp.]|nr:tRNA pseudouridine(55) synthase TruB [Eubacterium sp.]
MDGIINIYKEAGFTSFDVVAKLRGILREKKIGHTGTLDPQATGVLPVCIGHATKVCELLTDKDKEYEAVLCLGIKTDTQDATGQILSDRSEKVASLSEEQVRDAILSFIGEYDQIPPMYSALKVGGKKLCDLAREGIEVERKARRVKIFDIEILQMSLPEIKIRVHCSKGTYIRTLCEDIGELLGVGGMMKKLVRTRVSHFTLDNAFTLEQVEMYRDKGELMEILQPIDTVFLQYPSMHVREIEYAQKKLKNGNRLEMSDFMEQIQKEELQQGQPIRVYDAQNCFYGIYVYDEIRSDFKCKKMMIRLS